MTLPLQAVDDQASDQNFRQVGERFPIQGEDIAARAVSPDKLEKPPISGAVNADGTIALGSGFSVAHTGTGRYTIKLASALSSQAVCLVTPYGTFTQLWKASAPSLVEWSIAINGINFAKGIEEAADEPFGFVILTP